MTKSLSIPRVTMDGVDFTDPIEISNQFNTYFVSIGKELDEAFIGLGQNDVISKNISSNKFVLYR